MKHTVLITAAIAAFALASPASAACFVQYKAKKDNPLRLDFGEMQVGVSDCSRQGVADSVAAALAARGWTLLTIVSVREDAGG